MKQIIIFFIVVFTFAAHADRIPDRVVDTVSEMILVLEENPTLQTPVNAMQLATGKVYKIEYINFYVSNEKCFKHAVIRYRRAGDELLLARALVTSKKCFALRTWH